MIDWHSPISAASIRPCWSFSFKRECRFIFVGCKGFWQLILIRDGNRIYLRRIHFCEYSSLSGEWRYIDDYVVASLGHTDIEWGDIFEVYAGRGQFCWYSCRRWAMISCTTFWFEILFLSRTWDRYDRVQSSDSSDADSMIEPAISYEMWVSPSTHLIISHFLILDKNQTEIR